MTPRPIPQGSESLEVWSVLQDPWKLLGTILRKGGRDGTIVCTPPHLDCLLRRPSLLGYDAMDYLTGWCNTAVACWPRGKAPGAPRRRTDKLGSAASGKLAGVRQKGRKFF